MNDGLIHAFILDGHGGARRIDAVELASWRPGAGALWVHLDYTRTATQAWIREQGGVDELVAEALLAEETRPRVVGLDDGMLVALRGVNLNPDTDPEDMVAIRLWVDADRVISTRRRRLLSVEKMVESLERGRGPKTPADLLVDLIQRLTDRIAEVVDRGEDRVAALEDSVLEGEHGELRHELASLRRQVIAMRRYMAPQREALNRLHVEKASWLSAEDRLVIRELWDRTVRLVEDLDAVRERAGITQDEVANQLSERLNNRMYALSIIAGIFLPLGFLTGLLGINVGGIPGAENPEAFGIFLLLLLAIVVVQLWLFHKWRWL
jgi:zinc transporter